jgi:kynurenine formamidase
MARITRLDGVKALALRVRNWSRWGPDDELGTANFITPERIVKAARLVRKGKIFSLAMDFDRSGPQRHYPATTRFNPIHLMLRTGTDVAAGVASKRAFIRTTDDVIIMPTQAATHWDALSHVLYEGKMWNGYEASLVTSEGAKKNGIEKLRNRLAGRGVLIDVARYKRKNWLEPGQEITPEDLNGCLSFESTIVEPGDFVLVRTGQLRQVVEQGSWSDYAGGNAPGLSIETAEWLHEKQVAAVASDTWGVEVRPHVTTDCDMPWHTITISNMGLLVGEQFVLDELAEDCCNDKVYEFLFVAPAIPFIGAVGSPINPYAIK